MKHGGPLMDCGIPGPGVAPGGAWLSTDELPSPALLQEGRVELSRPICQSTCYIQYSLILIFKAPLPHLRQVLLLSQYPFFPGEEAESQKVKYLPCLSVQGQVCLPPSLDSSPIPEHHVSREAPGQPPSAV